MFNIPTKLALTAALTATLSFSALADTTQSTSPASYDNWGGWNSAILSQVTLANGTNSISALTGSANIVDQGWGNQGMGNGLYIELRSNGTQLWADLFAEANHNWTQVNYDASANASSFANLNSILAGINWATAPTVSVDLFANGIGYPGWQLHVQDAQFSVTSAAPVPEPETYALMIGGLSLIGAMARRRKQKQA